MDKNEKKKVRNPRHGANLLSIITFKWLFGTFLTGYKRDLEVEDLYDPLDEYASHRLGNKMFKEWKKENARRQKENGKYTPNLLKVLRNCFGFEVLTYGLALGILDFVVRTTQPIILANLLNYFSEKHQTERTEAFYWGSGIVIGILLDCFIGHLSFQGLLVMGMKIRVACCSLIYKKIMKISKAAVEAESSIGQMINLLSNDVNRLDYSMTCIHYVWIAPIQTALVLYLIYKEIGLAVVGGIILLPFIGIHGCYGKITSYLTLKLAYRTDERLRLTNEIISGVKVIKMYAWEKPFSLLINKAREKEVKVIRNSSMLTEICWSFESYIPKVCLFITILTYILLGNNIDAEKVYLVTAYYNVLRTTLYREFPLSIKELAEALVSVKRIQKFLMFEDIHYSSITNNSNNHANLEKNDDSAILFKDVNVKYNSEATVEILKDITFNIKPKTLTAIVGQVGVGKTSLFHAILNEIPFINGEIKINGKLSYSSQEPWLFTSSIKQNILFGQPMNKERYEKVIDACQLKQDFQLLPYGDNTLVSEKGINLSGGQCARINLARAVYHEADIYLLDDPLSAVDTRVGKDIFENCIKTFLKDKTVLLITHHLHFLKYVDKIIVLESGTLESEGTYAELMDSNVQLTKLMQSDTVSNEVSENTQTIVKENGLTTEASNLYQEEEEQAESRTIGNIQAKTYLGFFGAARNVCLVILVFLISAICQISTSGADYFITYWVNQEDSNGNFSMNNDDGIFRGRSWYIYVYGSIILASVLFTLAQAYFFFDMCMKISKNLHASMFSSIICTRMGFFNANPIGRIMNRFSKDMGIIDTRIPQTIIDVTQITLYTFAVVGIVGSVNPWFIIPAAILGIAAYFFRLFYIKTSRSIKRLEGITRSPVFNHLNASMHGLLTIRALNAQDLLIKEFDNHQDLHSSAWFIFCSGSRAFGMYIEFLCAIFTGVVIYTLILLSNVILAGDVGLVVTQCVLLTGMLQWGVRQTTELENQMTSIERVLEYSKLPKEENSNVKIDNRILENWPSNGQIVFQNVNLTYERQEKPALKNLNFTLESKEMIGIVGRTGAGKSSIINAIFRLANIDGEIFIDKIKTSQIDLQLLRSKISIIPQEPVLFASNLRKNLDPLEEYSDHDLWQALEDVELKSLIESDLGLNMKISEGGSNFSVGQRQLLCLARAIVRNNKILLLDEATANIDPRTDEIIQKAIRKKFVNCTVLIIAHRLNTIMDSDKVLVMDAGEVVEFDHPYTLLQRRGIFYNMVQQTGTGTAEKLFEMTKANFENKQKNHQL